MLVFDFIKQRTARALVSSALVVSLAVPMVTPAVAQAASAPSVAVPAATVQTLDGSTPMWSRRVTTKRHAASTIKMLTALVVREHTNMDDDVVVHKKAAAIEVGDVGLRAGQKVTVRQLMKLMLVASANDAAAALAIHVAGSERAFVRMMNEKAAELGLQQTRAVDSHGLSERELVSAGDLAVLAREVMADEALRPMLLAKTAYVPLPGGKSRRVKATNKMLGVYRGMEGAKTGYTSDAGFVFVGAAKRGEVELVGVVMGAKSNDARFAEMKKLLDWGFAHSRTRTVVPTSSALTTAPIEGGFKSSVGVHAIRKFKAVEFDQKPFSTKVKTFGGVTAPVRKGQRLGRIEIWRAGRLVDSRGLYADEAVDAVEQPSDVPQTRKLEKSIEVFAILKRIGSLIRELA